MYYVPYRAREFVRGYVKPEANVTFSLPFLEFTIYVVARTKPQVRLGLLFCDGGVVNGTKPISRIPTSKSWLAV